MKHGSRLVILGYLLSHNRPMSEVLAPLQKDIASEFERGFAGMTETDVSLDDLLEAQEALVATITAAMPPHHRQFLVGFERGMPDWSLLDVDGAADLPAVRWRQHNLEKLEPAERGKLADRLTEVLGGQC
jgi:hypothetical protein